MTSVCPAFKLFLCPGIPETIENNPSPSTSLPPEGNTICFEGNNQLEQKWSSSASQGQLMWCLLMPALRWPNPRWLPLNGEGLWSHDSQPPPSKAPVMSALPRQNQPVPISFPGLGNEGQIPRLAAVPPRCSLHRTHPG